MKIYIDESGGFSWGKEPDFSLFCGVTIADRDSDALFSRFAEWRRTIADDSKREIKGSELSDAQLETFADHLLHTRGRDILLTVVGLDTTRTKREHIEELRRQAWVMTERCAEIAAEHDNAWLAEFYRQEAGWLNKRSIENLLWMVGLVHTIFHSLQHTVIHYSDPEDDADYQLMNILIDRSFIHREQHINFWREWLRNSLTKSSMPPTLIPNTWRPRNHPFTQAYSVRPGLLDLRPLLHNSTGFFRSHEHTGLQIADICAHTICRYNRFDGAEAAYAKLSSRIVCENGAELYQVVVDERSLHTDDPRNHVGILDPAEYIDRAERLRAEANDPDA
jgi:hypothetical protein